MNIKLSENSQLITFIMKRLVIKKKDKICLIILLTVQVESNTGIISTKKAIDYEIYKNARFTITAIDGGVPAFTAEVEVDINIVDVNDNKPRFECSNKDDGHLYQPNEECFYNLELRSDTLVGHTFLELPVSDIDEVTRKWADLFILATRDEVKSCAFKRLLTFIIYFHISYS